MPKYTIFESVGRGVQRVHDYEDIERHHPSRGSERGRVYATVNGEREEILGNYRGSAMVSKDGDYFVSKDFVLKAGDSSVVPVPAVANGYVGRIDPSDGIVQIFDRPAGDPNREMIAQYRHMDMRHSDLKVGDWVGYGQPFGMQGGVEPAYEEDAKRMAMDRCLKTGEQCWVYYSACSLPVRVQ